MSTVSRDTQTLPALTSAERERYSRHILMPEVGETGQRRLKAARVLVIGAGGLGSPAALYLAAAGIGTLGLVDFDVVELSNLQRQLLHGTRDVGRAKVESARDRLADVNPHVTLRTHRERLTSSNALAIIGEYDLVLDGSDNFATRYLVNDACVLLARPYIYASIFRFDGQASVFAAADGPCYRCLFPVPPAPGTVPSCGEAGVLGVLPGLLGTVQATEAIKLVLGIGESLVGRLLVVDALGMRLRSIEIPRDPQCPACGTHEITALGDYDAMCGTAPARDADDVREVTPAQLAARMDAGDALLLIDVRETWEWERASIDGARLIPLGEFGGAIASLDRDTDLVIHCRVGARSAAAVRTLQHAGFTRVWNLAGGIERWYAELGEARLTIGA